MIIQFDASADINLWEPVSGAPIRIDTGVPTQPDRLVLSGHSVLHWPVLRGGQIRDENVPVGTVGAFVEVAPSATERDVWLLECCKLAATHFGAAKASQYDVEYIRG